MASTDPSALFLTHQPRLFRYFCRAVGDAETAKDLTQEVFLRATKATIPYAPEAGISAWLFRITRNLALDHHRRSQRGRADISPDVRPPSQDVDASVNQALRSLDQLDRDVFLLRELGGLSYDEIASACELTPDAVRSRIHRTRLALREQLAAPIATSRTTAISRFTTNLRNDP